MVRHLRDRAAEAEGACRVDEQRVDPPRPGAGRRRGSSMAAGFVRLVNMHTQPQGAEQFHVLFDQSLLRQHLADRRRRSPADPRPSTLPVSRATARDSDDLPGAVSRPDTGPARPDRPPGRRPGGRARRVRGRRVQYGPVIQGRAAILTWRLRRRVPGARARYEAGSRCCAGHRPRARARPSPRKWSGSMGAGHPPHGRGRRRPLDHPDLARPAQAGRRRAR